MEYGRKILVWNGIWKEILVWNMEWKIFGMEWKWNGRKLPVWNMEKSSSIPYHALVVNQLDCSINIKNTTQLQTKQSSNDFKVSTDMTFMPLILYTVSHWTIAWFAVGLVTLKTWVFMFVKQSNSLNFNSGKSMCSMLLWLMLQKFVFT